VLLKNEGRLSTWVASTFGWLVPLVFVRCKSTDSTGCRSDIGKRPPYIASGRARYQTPTADRAGSCFQGASIPGIDTSQYATHLRIPNLGASHLFARTTEATKLTDNFPTVLLTVLVTGLCDKAGSVMLHVTDSPGRIEAAAAKASAWATAQLHRREWQTRLQNEEENMGGEVEREGKRHTGIQTHSWSKNRATDHSQPDCYCCWSPPRVSLLRSTTIRAAATNDRSAPPTPAPSLLPPAARYPLRLRGVFGE
jgi:hypothetical protein